MKPVDTSNTSGTPVLVPSDSASASLIAPAAQSPTPPLAPLPGIDDGTGMSARGKDVGLGILETEGLGGINLGSVGLDSLDLSNTRRARSGSSRSNGSRRKARALDDAFVHMRRKAVPISDVLAQSPRLKSVLRGMLLFKGVRGEDFDRFYSLLRWRRVASGSQILTGGEQSPWVFLIAEGTVKIHQESVGGTQVIYSICGSGEILGELSAVDGDGHSATATVLDSALVGAIDRNEFVAFLLGTPQMSLNLAAVTSRRLRAATARIDSLSRLDVTGRLTAQILLFAAHYGYCINLPEPASAGKAAEKTSARTAIAIDLHLRQSDLADLIGASRVRVNQALHQLRRLGQIEVSGNRITLLDVEGLRARCR